MLIFTVSYKNLYAISFTSFHMYDNIILISFYPKCYLERIYLTA